MKVLHALLLVFLLAAIPQASLANGGAPEAKKEPAKTEYKSGMTLEQVRALRDARRAETGANGVLAAKRAVDAAPMEAERWVEYVEALAGEERLDEAIAAAKQCLTIHPYLGSLRLRMAELYERQGNNDLAMREYRMVVTDFPRWVRARIEYAILLEKLDRRVEANEQWTVVRERSQKVQVLQTAARHIAENG